jgi:ribosomal protein S18 acetylase RimI-like enzyme
MDAQMSNGQMQVTFSHLRLPRSMRVEYPRTAEMLAGDWPMRDGVLIAERDGHILGYVSLNEHTAQRAAHIGDLVVRRRYRRAGVGSQLVGGALRWARERALKQLVVEVQTKNHPAIEFLNKLGFSFCGFNDQHYLNQDIALFFSRAVR